MPPAKRRPHQFSGSSFIPRCSIAAFCSSEAALATLNEVAANPVMVRAQMEVRTGTLESALETYQIGRTPDLLIIEFDGPPDALDPLADVCSEDTLVIVIGSENDVIQYRKLMAKGVGDYLFHPLTADLVISSLMRIFAGQRPFNAAELIAVVGAGGGMGASTVAQSVALALSEDPEAKVLILDLDLYFNTSTLNFDFVPLKGLRDLLRFSGILSVADVELLMIEQRPRLFVLAAEPDLMPPGRFDLEILMKIIDIASLTVDFVVIDLPSGWGEMHDTVVDRADAVVVVTQTTLSGYRNTALIKSHLDLNTQRALAPQLVLNRYDGASSAQVSLDTFNTLFGASNVSTLPSLTEVFVRAAEDSKLPIELPGGRPLRLGLAQMIERITGETLSEAAKARLPIWRRLWPWRG